MNKEEKREMKKLIREKLFIVLTGITESSDLEKDKCAAEAASALVNTLLSLQQVKPDLVELKIVLIHNNLYTGRYDWLRKHKDLILVCGIEETCEKVAHLGTPIYLPLSIDVGYVEQFRVPDEEREGMAFAGRRSKMGRWEGEKPEGLSILSGMNRTHMLQEMAKREVIYAVGRTAIEARCLGCEIRAYDPRYPDPGIWNVLDNKDAARMLQRKLDMIEQKEGNEQWGTEQYT